MKLLVLIVSIMTFNLVAMPVLAHSPITRANIEAGAHYEVAPATFDFSFTKAVGLAKISLKTESGKVISLAFEKPKTMQKAFIVPLPKLEDGHYVINWSAVASDGHIMKGEISFAIGRAKVIPEQHGEVHKDH